MDLGEVGRRSDGGIFSNCAFGKALDNGTFELPRPSPLPGTIHHSSHILLWETQLFRCVITCLGATYLVINYTFNM